MTRSRKGIFTGRVVMMMRLERVSGKMTAVPEMRFFSLDIGAPVPSPAGTMTPPPGPPAAAPPGAPLAELPSILFIRSATFSASARLSCTNSVVTVAGGMSMSSFSAMSWRIVLVFSVRMMACAVGAGTYEP